MNTYLILNLICTAVISLLLLTRPKLSLKSALILIGALFIMTAVFDSLIVGFSVVAYDTSKILGVYIGNAPIEDFFYPLAAVVIVPSVWCIVEKRYSKN